MNRTGAHMLAHQVHRSLLVDALAHPEHPHAPQHPAGTVQPLQPLIHLTSLIWHRRPSSQLANEYPAAAAARHLHDRKAEAVNKVCVRLPPASRHRSPPPFVRCQPWRHRRPRSTRPPHWHRLTTSLQTLILPSRRRVRTRGMMYGVAANWECVHPHSRCKYQYYRA